MKHLEQFAQDRIDVQCLVCDWKGKWLDVKWIRTESNDPKATVRVFINTGTCPKCPDGYLVTAEERKSDEFWEIRPGLKEKIAALKRASKPIPPCP